MKDKELSVLLGKSIDQIERLVKLNDELQSTLRSANEIIAMQKQLIDTLKNPPIQPPKEIDFSNRIPNYLN